MWLSAFLGEMTGRRAISAVVSPVAASLQHFGLSVGHPGWQGVWPCQVASRGQHAFDGKVCYVRSSEDTAQVAAALTP